MKANQVENAILKIAVFVAFFLLLAPAAINNLSAAAQTDSGSNPESQIQIPNRAPKPLFAGAQGKQRSEIVFDPANRLVTLKFAVQDPNDYFIPNIRRDNFVVYENAVRQQIVSEDVEHTPVSVALLMEFGGRAPSLNRMTGMEVSRAGRQILDVITPQDKLAIWRYSDKIEKVADFSQSREVRDHVLGNLSTPEISETNLYDAVIAMIDQMKPVKGRKAIVAITAGIDTFSKAKYADALNAARESDSPIYVIALTRTVRDLVLLHENVGALAHIDWDKVEKELQEIARTSGGRAYFPSDTLDLSAMYDDLMENLKVRYVTTYRSSNSADLNSPRTVRVELIDPTTRGPLKIIDQNGRTVRAKVAIQQSYIPKEVVAAK
jgi:VWFA-related protein